MDRTLSFQNQHCTAMRADGVGTLELLLSGSRRNGGESPDYVATGRDIHPQALLWGSPHGCRIAESRLLGQSKTGPTPVAKDGTGGRLSEAETEPRRARSQDISISAKRIDNQSSESGLEHRYNLCSTETRLCLFGGRNGLVQPLRAVLGNIHNDGDGFLRIRPGLGTSAWQAGYLQYGPGIAVHKPGFYEKIAGSGNSHQHGRPWEGVRQRFCLTLHLLQ